ncbi:hypothetical protein QBC46DRAFT_76782 [Diplogelasinospora grovesii]|uniref:Uncharacterized protein n=1 Tax=Diplogelasinospora grovesii TaxID=303347 RepID=A0AAN6MX13_9PEZI|nr:hypothetical protein QBC46DRAFT_76782 [Diplogelasinospora grovesii]
MSQLETLTTAARRELQKQWLLQLCQLQNDIDDLRQAVLDDGQLESLCIRKLPPLDVDGTAPFDPEPNFFRPYPLDDNQDFPTVVNQHLDGQEGKIWRNGCKYDEYDDCPDWHCADFRAIWFKESLGLDDGILEQMGWDSATCDLCYGEYTGCYADRVFIRGHDDNVFNYGHVCRVHGGVKPHTSMFVYNSTRGESKTLVSEVVSAIAMIIYRLRHEEFVDHHTIPAIVHSFHHSKTARITQAHWDGTSVVIRQSRLLDIEGNVPTEDAYVLLRWLASKPVGDTKYQSINADEVSVDGGRPAQPLAGAIPVRS